MNLVSQLRELTMGDSRAQAAAKEVEEEQLDQELENILNHPAPAYSDKAYWDNRYEREPDPFDWYQPWSRLKPLVLPHIPGRTSALDVGCGNSPLTSSLLEDGFAEVVGLDISPVVIRQNEQRFNAEPRLKWICSDATSMTQVQSGKFDAVFDKGTIDSLMSSGTSARLVAPMLAEISRVLKPGGVFVEVSYGTANTRASFLKNPTYGWSVLETREIEKPTEKGTSHFIYMAVKN
jgi:ubiquinone/menaquinone biosynthesis C-methylase UbiE